MTEAEWLASSDPAAMLRYLTFGDEPVAQRPDRNPRVSGRKLRLWVEACRLRWRRDDRCFGNYDIERDGLRGALSAWCEYQPSVMVDNPLIERAAILREIVGNPFSPVVLPTKSGEIMCDSCGSVNPTVDFSTLRCLGCGKGTATMKPAFCPWLTPQALSLARAAYDESVPSGTLDNFRLALLADALEEAGCDNACLLDHLRDVDDCPKCGGKGRVITSGDYRVFVPQPHVSLTAGTMERVTAACPDCKGKKRTRVPKPHVRGCWSLDLILGKK